MADGGIVRRVIDGQLGPVLAGGRPSPLDARAVDGQGESAIITGFTNPVVTDDGRLAFADRYRVRLASADGQVRTLAGAPHVPEARDAFHGYAVSVRDGRMLAGSPRSPLSLSPIERVGTATVDIRGPAFYAPVASSVVSVQQGEVFGRYGTAVAWVGEHTVALGPANGCLWMARDVCGDDKTGRPDATRVDPIRVFHQLDDGRWVQRAALPLPDVAPRSGYGSALASAGRWLVAGANEWYHLPQAHADSAMLGAGRVFVYDLDTLDTDGDSMPDNWEEAFGLDPDDPADAALDPDGDGQTNAQEHAAQSHPHNDPAFTRYFAEGATLDPFETTFALVNPGVADARVLLRFLRRDGVTSSTVVPVPSLQRRTVTASEVPELDGQEFSTVIESDRLVVADRTMTWPRRDPVWRARGNGRGRAVFDVVLSRREPPRAGSTCSICCRTRTPRPPRCACVICVPLVARSRRRTRSRPSPAPTSGSTSRSSRPAVGTSLSPTPMSRRLSRYRTTSPSSSNGRCTRTSPDSSSGRDTAARG